MKIGMYEFLEDSMTTQIVATPFIDQSGRPFILSDVPKTIVETHRHIISTTCEKTIGETINICSLRNAVDVNANLACVNALTSQSKNLIKISCKKSSYRGDKCITYGLPNGGYAVWSSKGIEIKALARDNAFSKTIRMIKPNNLTIISEKDVNFECNAVQYSTNSDTKEISYEANSEINIDLEAKNIINDEFGLFNNRLSEIEKIQIANHKNATSLATSQLSKILNINPKHEPKIIVFFRYLIYGLAAMSTFWIMKKLITFAINKYKKYKRKKRRSFTDLINNQVRPDNSRTEITTEQQTTSNL